MTLLFSIYTTKCGYETIGFGELDKNGKTAFEQAIAYTQINYNDPHDKPKLYLLAEIHMDWYNVKRTPAEWEAIQGIEILDDDGWRSGCELGVKSLLTPITEAEFNARRDESTIMPLRPKAWCAGNGGADCKCHCH